ncbi:hypothetical protein QYF36_023415 [Acer negundo]|nr:hypothetical protein QYF36_023415 [Acer negundo]
MSDGSDSGSLRLRRSDHHSKVGLGFTNVVGTPLAVSEGGESNEEEEEEEDEEEEEEEEVGGTEMILIAMWVTWTMPEGFRYVTDSTVTEETLRRLRDNKMGFAVPNTKGKDGDWKSEWIVIEGKWGQDCFIAGESNWKKQGDVSLPEESRKILQRIKDKKYNPLGRGGDPFNQYLVHQILKISAPSHGYQASDLFQIVHSVTKLTLPHSPRLIEVKKEEGSKQWSVPVRIPKLPILSIFSAKLSILELETWLGHGQASSILDKGKGPLKAFNIPAFKEKEPPTFSEEEVVEAFRSICPGRGLLFLVSDSRFRGEGNGGRISRVDPERVLFGHSSSAQEALVDFDLSLIHGWDWERILATAEEMEAKAAALDPNLIPANNMTSSNWHSKGDANANKGVGEKGGQSRGGPEGSWCRGSGAR